MTDETIQIINVPMRVPVKTINDGGVELYATSKGWTPTIAVEVVDESTPTGTRQDIIPNPISAMDFSIGVVQKAFLSDFIAAYSNYVNSQAQLKIDNDLKNMGLK